jgi:hypothetical protein
MKRALLFLILTGLSATACGPQPIPTPDPILVQASAAAIAGTAIAETQTAYPTPTPLPTETPTPLPTFTAVPLPTLGTPTAVVATGNCRQPLTTWDGASAKVYFLNQTKLPDIILSLSITTQLGECGYRGYNFGNSAQDMLPLGSYSAFAYVSNKFTVGGSFLISKEQNWSIIIKTDRIVLQAGCVRLGATC